MKKIFVFIIIFSIMINFKHVYAISLVPVWSNIEVTSSVNAEIPDNSIEYESESVILIEESTGEVLFEKKSHEQLRPASVTKVMTLLLIMESLDKGEITLETMIPCSEHASSMGGSQIWLDTREELSVNEMLKAICVVSANDCTVAMAEYLAGSEESFVQKMNQRAKELGMNDTHFVNCHGIDEDNHLTSAYDISLMSRELLHNHPQIKNYTTIYMDSLRNGTSELVNTNKLLRTYNGCTGLKTGSTGLALYNLSASATRDGLSLIAVVMKAPSTKTRFAEARKLLDYGFANYAAISYGKTGEIVTTVNVQKGTSKTVNAILSSSAVVVTKKALAPNVTQNIDIISEIQAPIEKGQKIGTISYMLNDEIIASIDVIAENEIKRATLFNNGNIIYKKWFNLLRKQI